MKDFIYSILYGSPLMSHKEDKCFTEYIAALLKIGVKNVVRDDDYYCTIYFNNNISICYWDENRWYAWFSRGKIYEGSVLVHHFDDTRPSRSMLYQLKRICIPLTKKQIPKSIFCKLKQSI